jgi:hypothetical protein
VRWFRKCHPEISVRMSQGLDSGRARGLCPKNVSSFYENLEVMLVKGYEASHIWNCDELGTQAGRNGGGRVLVKNRGTKCTLHYSEGARVAIGFGLCECGWLPHSQLLHFPR